jgi:hypothetical protein
MSPPTVTATEDALLTALLHAAKFPSCAVSGALLGPATSAQTTSITAAIPLFHHPTAAMAACVEAGLAQVEALASSRGLALVGYYHAPVHYAAPGPRAAAAGVDEDPSPAAAAASGGGEGENDDENDKDDAARLRSLPPPVRRIAERIAERRPGGGAAAVVLAVNNPRLARFSGVVGGGGGKSASSGAAAAAASSEPPCPFDVYAAPGWQRVGGAGSSASSPLRLDGPASWQGLQRRFLNARDARLHRRLVDFDEHVDDVSRDYTNPGLLGEATRTLVR